MITRGELLLLGITSGVVGSLTGGVMLFAGMSMIVAGANLGWVLLLPAAPASGLFGWLLARKLARQLGK
jgi:hypothetical protein